MSPVVVPGRVNVCHAVQSVLNVMIWDALLIQIIANGIYIAVYIYVPILPKINRYIRLLEHRKLFGKTNPVYHIPQQSAGILTILCKLRKEIIPLFVIFHNCLKQPGFLYSLLQLFKVNGHFA